MAKNAVLDLKRAGAPARAVRTNVPVARRGFKPELRARKSASEEPRVVPIYWDPHFRKSPADVAAFDEFLRSLFRSSWMSALAEYGVAPARVLPSFVPADAPCAQLSQPQLEERLMQWVTTESALPAPSKAERSLIYLLVTPLTTELTLGNLSSSKDFSGYHDCTSFTRASEAPGPLKNLFYAAVPLAVTGKQILDAHSRAISKELAESFIDRARWLGDPGRVPTVKRRPARAAV